MGTAVDKGYDDGNFRTALRDTGARPLIEHHVFASYDNANNAPSTTSYHQRLTPESVDSWVKRYHGEAARARTWFGQFREILLKIGFHDLERATDA